MSVNSIVEYLQESLDLDSKADTENTDPSMRIKFLLERLTEYFSMIRRDGLLDKGLHSIPSYMIRERIEACKFEYLIRAEQESQKLESGAQRLAFWKHQVVKIPRLIRLPQGTDPRCYSILESVTEFWVKESEDVIIDLELRDIPIEQSKELNRKQSSAKSDTVSKPSKERLTTSQIAIFMRYLFSAHSEIRCNGNKFGQVMSQITGLDKTNLRKVFHNPFEKSKPQKLSRDFEVVAELLKFLEINIRADKLENMIHKSIDDEDLEKKRV